MIIKTTNEILNNPWGEISTEDILYQRTPSTWASDTPLKIKNVKKWEEIYYSPGAFGVYVSWEPYAEFYIITHNLHLDESFIEVFQGASAVDDVIERCKRFGINIDYNVVN